MMKEMEMKRVPKLRFPEFTDDWEQRKLGELALFNPKDELPQTFEYVDLESVVGTVMLSHRTEEKSSAPSRAQRLAHTGDLFYQTVRPYQKNNYLFEMPDNNYVFSTGYAQMRPYVDGYFLLSLVQSDRFVKVVLDNCTGTSYPAINANDLAEIEVATPSDENEAQKIGTIFRNFDHLITLHQRKLEKLKELKKGLVQKLFSQEVRFKADDGSEFPKWEEKRLSGLFGKVIEKNRLDLPALTIIQGYGTIRRDESERKITYDEKGLKNYKAVQKDDFIVHLRSFEGGLEIANQDGIVSPAYHVYRGNDEVHPLFYYPYFRSSSFIKGKLAVCVTGVRDGKNIEMGAFDELLIPHPCLAEQQKIAECLSALDDVIEKQKATLAAWEELKKGLLQQMFV